MELTPRVAPEVLPEEEAEAEVVKLKRKPKEKKQIIDAVIELADGPGRGRGGRGFGPPVVKDVSDILAEQRYLPRSAIVMRLMEIREDPLAHFLPTKMTPEGTYLCVGPPGLAPELSDLFMRPTQSGQTSKKRGASPEKTGRKKAKVEESVRDEEEVEQGRREASVAPSVGIPSDVLGGRASLVPEGGFDFGDMTAGGDDFQMEIPSDVLVARQDIKVSRAGSLAPSELTRLSTPGVEGEGEESYADLTCPIASFDVRPAQSSSQSHETDGESSEGKGYSKNTMKALAIARKEMQPTDDGEERVMSFARMSQKASRRAAATFFFELLVLGTRDCVKLTQSTPFENIEIRAKTKLWERQGSSSEGPSVISVMGP